MAELPKFIVIGAAKSGTTSLHEYLRQHPEISLPLRKETHFFISDKNSLPYPPNYKGRQLEHPIDNLEDYLNDFEFKAGATTYAEVCPSYLFYPNAAINIYKYIPDAKIICILRNPVDRFYSNLNYRYTGDDSAQFNQVVNSILNKTSDIHINRLCEIGFYSILLTRYYEIFPHNNIKVLLFDDLQKHPKELMAELMEFIGFPDFPFDLGMKFNISGKIKFNWIYQKIRGSTFAATVRKLLPVKVYQSLRVLYERIIFQKSDPISPKSRKEMQNIYREDVLKLQSLIQRDLSEWLE